MRKPLYHLLYTNAPGAGGAGYRHLPVNFPAAGDPAPVQKWLETLQPVVPGASEGWAFQSFGIDRTQYAALAVVNPSFSPEDHGRGRTVLVHGLLLPLREGEAVGQFGRALYERAKSFLDSRADHQVDLDSYLTGCRTFGDVEVEEAEPQKLCHLEERFLRALFQAASQPVQAALFPGITVPEHLPEQILWAGASLPPRLRLQMRWRVGLPPGSEGFVAQPGESDVGGPVSRGAVFHAWLQQALQEERFEAVRQISENWEIRDWESVTEAVRTLADRPARRGVAAQVEDSEEGDMVKKRSTAGGDRPAASRSGKSAAAWDEEYQSLQKNLEEYVDRRLASLRGGDGPPVMYGSPGGPTRGFWARLGSLRPELYLVAIVLALVWLHWPPSTTNTTGVEPTPSEPPTPLVEPTVTPSPSPPPNSSEPLEAWGIYVDEHKSVVGAWFRALAKHQGLEERQVKPLIAKKFSAWADQFEEDEPLASKDREESVTGLFEYIHARWAQEHGKGDSKEDQVTLNPGEVQRNLTDLAAELGLGDELGDNPKVTDPKVQVAVTRAWLDQHPQP